MKASIWVHERCTWVYVFHSKVQSVKVWSVKCRVWNLKCGGVECKVQNVECGASLIDTATPQENERLETRHVGAEKPAFHETSSNFDIFCGSLDPCGCNLALERPDFH